MCVCVFRLQIHQDLREDLAKVKNLEALSGVSRHLKQRCQVPNHLSSPSLSLLYLLFLSAFQSSLPPSSHSWLFYLHRETTIM